MAIPTAGKTYRFGLRWQKRPTFKVNRRELHSARVDRRALRPRIGIFRHTLVFLGRIGHGEDNRTGVESRHRFNDLTREELSDGARTNENGGFENLDRTEKYWILSREIQMVERFGRRQFVSKGKFMRREVRPSRNHQSV